MFCILWSVPSTRALLTSNRSKTDQETNVKKFIFWLGLFLGLLGINLLVSDSEPTSKKLVFAIILLSTDSLLLTTVVALGTHEQLVKLQDRMSKLEEKESQQHS